jgi:hypothetical protein
MRRGSFDGSSDWLIDHRLHVTSRPQGTELTDALVAWVPDVQRAGPALIFTGAADWQPASAYLPALGGALQVHLLLDQRVRSRAPMARRLVLTSRAWRDGRNSCTASLLRGVESLSGWGLPSDLRVRYPEPVAAEGPAILQLAIAGEPTRPVHADPVRPCGGLVLRGERAAENQILILWRDGAGPRGWSQLSTHRPFDADRTFAIGDRIWGDNSGAVNPPAAAILEGDPRRVRLFEYPVVDQAVERAVALLQPRLVLRAVRSL